MSIRNPTPCLCSCGCGQMTKGQHKKGALPFVTGHQNRGRRFSQAGKPRGFPEGTLLDDADREVYGVHRWSISGNGYLQRAKRLADGRLTKVRLHREILGQPAGIVDHINGNRLDNRRANLRVVDDQGNAQNQCLSPRNTSGHRGVSWNKKTGKWYAHAKIDGKMISLGFYDDLEEAAKVAREYREKHYAAFVNR